MNVLSCGPKVSKHFENFGRHFPALYPQKSSQRVRACTAHDGAIYSKNRKIVPYYMAISVSGQDESNPVLWLATRGGKMELSCPLGTTRRVPQEKFPIKPYNKSFIDQACSVKIAGYWPRSFFCEFMDLDSVSVHKHAKKELGQYPAILTEQAWSITHTYHEDSPNTSNSARLRSPSPIMAPDTPQKAEW